MDRGQVCTDRRMQTPDLLHLSATTDSRQRQQNPIAPAVALTIDYTTEAAMRDIGFSIQLAVMANDK